MRWASRLAGWLVVVIASGIVEAGAANLLKNGDFEQVEGERPAGWIPMNKNAGGRLVKDAGFMHGEYSLYLKSRADNEGSGTNVAMVGATSGVTPGGNYRFEFYARGEKEGQPLTIIFYTHPLKDGGGHWYRKKDIVLTGAWKKYTLETLLPDAAEWKNRQLLMVFQVPCGGAYIDDAMLTAQNAVGTEPQNTHAKRRNLLENPGFDHGVGGWFAEVWGSQWQSSPTRMARDYEVRRDGECSLKLIGGGESVISRRYAFKPGVRYTLSFYARSEDQSGGGLRAFVITPSWKVARLDIAGRQLSREWQRYTLAFQADNQGDVYSNSCYLRFDPLSTVWLDSVQLEESEKATVYTAGTQVGLEPVAATGVYQQGKPAEIKVYGQTGAEAEGGQVLTLRGRDVYGNELWSRSQKIEGGKAFSRVMTVPSERCGVVDLSVTLASVTAPEKVLAASEWRLAVVNGDIALPPNPLFGADTDLCWHPEARVAADEATTALFGAGFGRTFFPPAWYPGDCSSFDPNEPGQVRSLRTRLDSGRKSDKAVIVVMAPAHDSPLNLREMKKQGRIPSAAELEPAIEAYAALVATNIRAMEGRLKIVEVLNEPNIWIVGGKNAMPPETYIKVLAKVHNVVRSTDQKTRLAANVNGIDLGYLGRLMELGAGKYIDVVTVHPYRNSAENPPLFEDYRKLRALLDRARPGIPVINSEQYYGVRNLIYQHEFDRNYFADTEEDMAGRMTQTALHGIAADLVPFGHFSTCLNLAQPGISAAPFYYHYLGMARTLGSLFRGVVRGEEIVGDKSLRIFFFELQDGRKLVSANTRSYGVKGTMKVSLEPASLLDAAGNQLSRGAVNIGYLPTYWVYDGKSTTAAIRAAFQSAICRGFEFPVEVSPMIGEDGQLQLRLQNVTNAPVAGTIRFSGNESPWRTPAEQRFKLPVGGMQIINAVATGKPVWNAMYSIKYTAQTDDQVCNRTLRLPSATIPRTVGSRPDWKHGVWIELGEANKSKDFNAKETHRGPADLAAEFALRWSDDGLYLAVRVKDDAVVKPGKGEELYQGDSLQLYFDCGNSGGTSYDRDDVVYTVGVDGSGQPRAYLEKGPGTRYVGEANAETGIDEAVKIKYTVTDGGYEYELFFPNYTLPFLMLKPGTLMGFALLINDNDGHGRKQGLTTGPVMTEPYGRPNSWHCRQLGK